MSTYRLSREIPVEKSYDVVVCGGGPGGVSAAISAARLGASVLLIEATGSLGGMGTNGLVSNWYALSDGVRVLTAGLFWEVLLEMQNREGLPPGTDVTKFGTTNNAGTGFSAEVLKKLLDELCINAGVDLLFGTKLIDADADAKSRRVNGIVVHHIEGMRYVPGKCFVDATGDAVLAKLCGAECREAGKDTPHIMPPTLCGLVCNVDWDKATNKDEVQDPAIEKAIADGFFTQPDRHVPGVFRSAGSFGILNAGHLFKMNALKVRSLTGGYILGRKLAAEYTEFHRRYMPGCEDMELSATASLMGVRESRRIVGEKELVYDDFKKRRHFTDQIGVYKKAVDIHVYDLTPEQWERYSSEYRDRDRCAIGESYGMPYGITVPRGWQNLWAAGKSVSADVKMHGSIRDQPACFLIGQAVGTAAVQSNATGQPACDLDTKQLAETLRRNGAYLPEVKSAV